MLLYNPPGVRGLVTDNHFVPTVHLESDAGAQLLDTVSTWSSVAATFTAGTPSTVQGDVMAGFSSRGGPGQSLGVTKPDLVAPGVQILAGHTPNPASLVGGPPGELFQAISGTSMSSPHVAGAAALLKNLHPEWTPGQVKSALMTTALTAGVTKEDGMTPADSFDVGSGRLNLANAGNVGLTFDETALNYLRLRNELWMANYPSLYIPRMAADTVVVQRTVCNAVPRRQSWRATVSAPPDLTVIVVPRRIQLDPVSCATFSITVWAGRVPDGASRYAAIEFKRRNRDQPLRFPITVVR